MICRSAVIPAIIGLGAAAVMAAGGATAVAGAPAPTLGLSVTASETSTTPEKTVTISTKAVINGERKPAKLDITKVVVTGTPDKGGPHVAGGCDAEKKACNLLGEKGDILDGKTLLSLKDKKITVSVEVSVTITVEATVDGKVESDTRKATVTFAQPVGPGPGSPSKSDSPTPPRTSKASKPPKSSKTPPSRRPSASKSSGSGGSSGSSGSGGSSSGGGGTTGGVIPPAPNSSFDPRNPQVALPPITTPSAQNPSVAPNPAMTPQSRLQGNKAPVAQDLTFERMASTQIAWLAALIVAFSLLLTQVRLGRRRQPAGAPRRTRGTHRRPRHGMFGK